MAKIRTFSLKIFMLKVSYCFQSLSVASRAASTMLSMANMGLDTRKPVLGGGGGVANNTGADQPAHLHSLISAFFIHVLESTISKLSTIEISFSSQSLSLSRLV